MVEVKDLTIETKTQRPLIDSLSMTVSEGDKIAVIGEEGNGKSTFLKAINNIQEIEKYCSVKGEISKGKLIVGYLEQSLNPEWFDTHINEYFLKRIPSEDPDYTRYEKMGEVYKSIAKVGMDPKILDSDQTMGTLSGGEKVKLQIAKLLADNPDILLLDEPTNDLDLETLEWLEDFIKSQRIPILYISHDETLLENTANKILHFEHLKHKNKAVNALEVLGYIEYITKRQQEIEKQEQGAGREKREFRKDMQIISHQKSLVRTQQEKIIDSTMRRTMNKKMRTILREEDKAKRKLITEKPETEEPIYISFSENSSIPNGKVVLDFFLNELRIGKRLLSKDIELKVTGPEKIAIIGRNGSGKTTLIRKIFDELKERDDVKVGYMPQDYDEILKGEQVAIDYLMEGLPLFEKEKISSYMGRIKLTWGEMNSRIEDLSYGQKAKLIILKMMLDESNVLILDEPTRNLSPLSNPVIRKMLEDFPGAIISISHDRKFLKEVCTKIYNLDENGLKIFSEPLS